MLQSIPKPLYESAKISGAKSMKQFTTITAPMIIMQISPLLIGQFVGNFNNFGIIYLFNSGGPFIPGSDAGGTDIFMS
jgi:arabinogalactan oligomer/maltooligosaccharide transport system permease protein